MTKTLKIHIKTIWMWIEYYCYGKWVGGYFHPKSMEIVEIELNSLVRKTNILNTAFNEQPK